MKTGRNLQEVLVELNRQNQAKQDFISPAQGMRLREDGHTFEINHLTTSQQEVFGTTSLFHRQVASALGMPEPTPACTSKIMRAPWRMPPDRTSAGRASVSVV